MPQPWISYKVLKRIVGVIVIFISAGILYNIYSNVSLFQHGTKINGTVTKKEYINASMSTVYIEYELNNQNVVVQETPILDGTSYIVGDRVFVYINPRNPESFTTSRQNAVTAWQYLADHTFFVLDLLLAAVFLFVGFKWLFAKRDQAVQVKN